MRWLPTYMFIGLFCLSIVSCDNAPKPTDTLTTGAIDISADETYRNVIEAQAKVFDSSFPDAKVTIHYKPEAECFKDYFDHKARIILVTRDLTPEEKVQAEQKQIYATSVALAKDALAVLLNKENNDSLLNIEQLKGILTGANPKYKVVFDNQASSLVRYITDSLLMGKPLGSNVFAAHSNKEVVDYVMNNPNAVGFAGLSDVCDTADVNNTGEFIKSVRIASIYNEQYQVFLKPYLAYLALKQYPLTRKLYYVSAESYPGLGTGFAKFLKESRGQLIFAHAHLYPLWMEITIREAEINRK